MPVPYLAIICRQSRNLGQASTMIITGVRRQGKMFYAKNRTERLQPSNASLSEFQFNAQRRQSPNDIGQPSFTGS